MNWRCCRRFQALLLLMAFMPLVCWGQNTTGSISGTVTDPSGAVVSGAKVTLTNTDTNVKVRTVTTDSSGNYSAPLLPIGTYTVSVEAPGFSTYQQTGVAVHVNDHLTVSPKMQLASAAQTVEVQAATNQVQLQSAAATGLVTGQQIRELPLTTRNYEQLVTLMPGVSNTSTSDQIYVGAFSPIGTNVVTFAVNGQRSSQNNWTVDGFDNVDRGANLTLLTFPSVDSIAEFKVLRGEYAPEYGRAGGGQVNVITRSGTSSFHGGAYEFFRNDVLNANSYFNNQNKIKRPPLRYNNFGWTLGGPVYIPHVYNTQKNKTFFFFSQEFRRVITYSNPTALIPTVAERSGNFADPVCVSFDASGNCTGTSTSIPQSSWSPTAAAYVKDIFSKYPAPNDVSNTHLLRAGTYRSLYNFREEMLHVDQVFGPRLSVNGKILRDSIPTIEPGGLFTGLGVPGIATTSTNSPGHEYEIAATATLSPTTLLNFGYGYSYGAIVSQVTGLENAALSPDINPTMPYKNTQGRVPTLSFTGASGLPDFGPYRDFNFNHTVYGNFTKVMGSHTLKFGVSYYHYRKTENAGGGPQGSFSFTNEGVPSGTLNIEQSWANFLLGRVASFTQSSVDITPDIRTNQIESYAQDEWRMRPNLTLSYGVRWSIYRMPTDAKGLLSNFDPRAYDPSKAACIAPNGLIDPVCGPGSTPGVPVADPANYTNGIIYPGKNSPFGSKVDNEDMRNFAPRVGVVWDPWGNGKTAIRAGYGMFYDSILFGNYEINEFVNPPFVQSINIPNTNFDNPGTGIPSVSLSPKRIRSLFATPYHTPYTEQWSFDVQHDLGSGFILDLGYYGSEAHHLMGQIDMNQPTPGAYLSTLVCAAGQTTNCVPQGQPITYATNNLLNRIRPYRGYGAIDANETIFNSNYHSLQVQAQKQWRSGSLFNIAYTWSHNLTDNQTDRSTAAQDTYCPHACEYGPAAADRRHIFTANWLYDLPWMKDQQGFVGHILGGWEFNGIFTAQSGTPLTIFTLANADPAGLGCLGPSPCSIRPDQVANPDLGAPHTFAEWFNTAAFQNVPAGVFTPGNERRGTATGPGFWRADLSMYKNIKITERVNTQFRLESLNTFNHTNPVCCGSTYLGSSLFGKITSTRDPRVVQLGLKLNF